MQNSKRCLLRQTEQGRFCRPFFLCTLQITLLLVAALETGHLKDLAELRIQPQGHRTARSNDKSVNFLFLGAPLSTNVLDTPSTEKYESQSIAVHAYLMESFGYVCHLRVTSAQDL